MEKILEQLLRGIKMSKQILKDMETKAEKTLHALREELKTVRAGRANPSVLDNII